MTAPVGLHGKGSMSAFVFGVIEARNSSAVSLNSFSALVSMNTGVPPASVVIGP
jgi:hypothetical protein